jgi:protein-S-isoprenylcysteine O-methyltransferase Ste14
MRRKLGKTRKSAGRLFLVAAVIVCWVVYRSTRNYVEHGRWDPIDMISTAVGACFGMLIGAGLIWCWDRMTAQPRR